jgi:hypothetical protein
MSNWREYDQELHSKEWWQGALLEYIKIKCPEKIRYNPKVDSVKSHVIEFGMMKHYGILIISKKTILETISPDLNKST